MPLSLDENQSAFQIKSYQSGFIQINDKIYTENLMLTPTKIFPNWELKSIDEMTFHSFRLLFDLKPDILIIGTGSEQKIIPIQQYGELFNLGIGVEVMNTGAACRTFNALTAENRHVAAALILA